jgi:hypothetical protein
MYGTSAEIYGTAPTFIGAVTPDTAMSATDSAQRGLRALVDPNNPMLWFLGIVLVTVGAAGVAGTVRLGPAKIGANLGEA